MTLCLFEDSLQTALLPLTYLHPDFDLRCGIFTARERAARFFAESDLCFHVRPELAEVTRERTQSPVNEPDTRPDVYLNGSALLNEWLHDAITRRIATNTVFVSGGRLIACTVRDDEFRLAVGQAIRGNDDLPAGASEVIEANIRCISFPWDLIALNREIVIEDARFMPVGSIHSSAHISSSTELLDQANIAIGEGCTVDAGVVVDAREGPVVIDGEAELMHHSIIIGPAYIGPKTIIRAGTRVYPGTSIGRVCKIGGEVEGSIFHSFANKQHDGFVGHSYFAPWTNLGADTNTSDLKNNYSEVRMTLEGVEHRTGCRHLGTVMADHSKCGINTMFNTGTCVGVGCNIFGGNFPPKYLPSFSWGGSDGIQPHSFDKFLETAEIVSLRRGITLSSHEKDLLMSVFQAVHHQPDHAV